MSRESDLQRICEIVHKRNEIQKRRNSARHRASRLQTILHSLKQQNKKKRVEKMADSSTNTYMKILKDLAEIKGKYHSDIDMYMFCNLREIIDKTEVKAKGTIAQANEELNCPYSWKVHHSKKYEKMTMHSIKTQLAKAVAERSMAEYETYQLTEDTTKEIRKLLKRNKMRVITDSSGGYNCIIERNENGDIINRINLKEIEKYAFYAAMERELASKE